MSILSLFLINFNSLKILLVIASSIKKGKACTGKWIAAELWSCMTGMLQRS